MEKHLGCLSVFSVGISAWLITMLMLMIMPSSSAEGFKITVKCYLKLTGHANAITVEVEGKETVKRLKQKIKEKTDIEPIRQTVEFKKYEDLRELEDEKKLADYGIIKDSEVIMLVDYPLMMVNSSTNGFKIKVTTDKKIFTRFIFHKTKTIPVRITGTLTVKQLKELIMEKGLDKETKDCIESDVHRLTLQHGTTADKVVLNDTKQMEEYGIRKGVEIFLSIDEFQISVIYTKEKKESEEEGEEKKKENKEEGEKEKKGKEVKEEKESEEEGEEKKKEKEVKEMIKLTIWVSGTDTVQMLKQKIKNATQIEPTRQLLTYRKPSVDRMPPTIKYSECVIFWLEAGQMLNAYGIGTDAIVYMEQK
ncbi:hypothetical protein niasHT_028253 [Heterodera trifolii]|uniref:Ubiquitin-like domain-containing protein n=1 Tax=Heterodera trifolii TaxID=157864 RepID=A0ABD2JUP0_9BILA